MRQAIIPAAGTGSRLGNITEEIPKCMIEVNGKTLIERTLVMLDKLKFDRVIIITGHADSTLRNHIAELNLETKIVFIYNENYANSNNIVSVSLALDLMCEMDSVLIESDLIFDESIIEELISEQGNFVVLSKYLPHMDGTVVHFDRRKMKFSSPKEATGGNELFKTVNIYQFTKDFVSNVFSPLIHIYLSQGSTGLYYETPLKLVSEINLSLLKPVITSDRWYEIDDVNDLDIASQMFSMTPLPDMDLRYGGYWRFPDLKDYVYLSNPFFPDNSMLDEIQNSLSTLIHHYPSSLHVNNKLTASLLNVREDYVLVGNGASELINIVCKRFKHVGVYSPTFKEYERRCIKFTKIFDLDDLPHGLDAVIIVNPNNPTGKLIPQADIIALVKSYPNIQFIVDESFMAFSNSDQSLLKNNFLEMHENLLIMNSISKSHGLGGLRLGALIGRTANSYMEDVPVWNINSIAEFFLQRFKKHEKSYLKSLEMVKSERKNMEVALRRILGIPINDSNGNFVYFEIDKISAKHLKEKLYECGFLVKMIDLDDRCAAMRIAIRTGFENIQLIKSLERIWNEYSKT